MRGLPVTLWRFIAADLWRLILLSTAVLVVVIAFAATVKPLSEGKLEASDALRFMFYAIPPMMAYALPFAAGFAATMCYHRIASDNEAVAAHAGGISHVRLLLPAGVTSVVLFVAVLTLSDQVIPRFLRQMQRMITVDVSRLVASEIARGNSVQQKNLLIYADAGKSFGGDEVSGALDRVVLSRFAAIELARDGTPLTEASSNLATMWLFPGEDNSDSPASSTATATQGGTGGQSRVVMKLQNVVAIKENEWTTGSKETVLRWNVPNVFKDSAAFLTFRELQQLADTPERMSGINFPRRDLAILIGERDARRILEENAVRNGVFELEDQRKQRVVVRAGGLRWEGERLRLLPAPGKTVIEVLVSRGVDEASKSLTQISSPLAFLITDMGEDRYSRQLELRLDLKDAQTQDLTPGKGASIATQRGDMLIAELKMPRRADGSEYLASYLAMTSGQTLEEASRRKGDDFLTGHAVELQRKIRNLSRNVMATINERLAQAIACAIMTLLGAVASLRMGQRNPLAIYLWSFVPALIAMVTIQGGSQTIKASGELGLILMWSSPAALATYAFFLFRGLSRH